MYVVDASVFVADARPSEPHHTEAHAFLARAASEGWPIYLPMIILAEIAAAISRGTGQPALAHLWVRALRKLPHFQFVPVDEPLGELAAEMAARYQIRGCDAIYVALARQSNATLITLDHQQRDRVPPDILAHTPGEELDVIS